MSNSYDPIDTCPYDPVHRVMRSRMQYHLTKCSKNYSCSNKWHCPYDARHLINQIEFNYHVSVCPQRESMRHNKLEENEKVEDYGILPIDPSPVLAPAEDVWEEEGNVESYDPIKHTENKLITRTLIGASKSQRKKHRLQERLRISRLADDAPKKEKDPATKSKNNQHATSTIKPSRSTEASEETKQIYQPLCCPKELPIDTLKIAKIATTNNSTIVHPMQNSVNQNEQMQFIQEKSNSNENLVPQTTFSYAAAAKNVLANQRQRYSSIESNYDVIESKQCNTEKENNNSCFNRNKEDLNLQTTCSYATAAKTILTNQHQRYSSTESYYDVIESKTKNKVFDLQESTFSYAAAAKNTLANQQYGYIESDYSFIESKKWDTEKEENNSSSFFNRSKYVDLPTTEISYATTAKIVPTLRRRQNCNKNINNDSKKDNNSLLTTNKSKDQQRTFNCATAAAKYMPAYLREQNSNIECDSDVVTGSIKSKTEKRNNSLLTNRNKDLDRQTTFNYTTDDENIPTIRRPQNSIIESDCDIISESIKYNSEKENSSIFFNRNKEDLDMQTSRFNYAAPTKFVPLNRQLNNTIQSDYELQSKFSYATTAKNVLTNQPQQSTSTESDYDMHAASLFRHATATKNVLINRRPHINSTESDYAESIESKNCDTEKENSCLFINNEIDGNLVKVTKIMKALSVGDERHTIKLESLDRTLESLKTTTNYSSITNNGLNRVNINKPLTSKKKSSRSASSLHFTNLRQFLQNKK